MPLYEYECVKCGYRFELLRSMSGSDRNIKCPKYGTGKVRRIISTFATTSGGNSCPPKQFYLKHEPIRQCASPEIILEEERRYANI